MKKSLDGVKTIFHVAANPEVRSENPEVLFRENIKNTFHLLEQIRESTVENVLFTSSSTVYGEPKIFPTPEDYTPLLPISTYGASKLACETLISSYCHTYGIKGRILRLANIVGFRSRHGIIWDFVNKLRKNKKMLEVLGDGTQSKSYLHVSDFIDSLLLCLKSPRVFEIFNVGNNDVIDAFSIARSVCEIMGLRETKIVTTGGVDNGRGWIGDVKKMHLEITKLKKLGFVPKLSSTEAVRLACQELVSDTVVKVIGS